MAQGDLNTTSYVILGLLTAKDRSAYEIAEQVGRGVSALWPRADRQRYNAPKRLLERGLVTARTEPAGKRRNRTIYSITPQGRAALTEWLATQSQPPALVFEGMIRVCFAEQGSIEDLRANLRNMRDQAEAARNLFISNAERMLEPDRGSHPERRHLLTLANRYMVGHYAHIIEWAEWALSETDSWPDTVSPADTSRGRTEEILKAVVRQGREG
ncbi:PadR family transcriptional regulator [Williamsia sp. DF01-3]|uniref:PadR family transcriptional regulator n=1 Tax=Williamsia sp. DF01-3 TaxID=2934157 RepID=UPI001FF38EA4|nr:PadR family transcriptional regulator [Williamsia sp. DF01-3]MCK0517454.1 PadR family transcriptional regulator [Williamsia sp. DF01-3]